jgi:3-hydroxyisobutyrate dehydrogenase-like beta-hydroxyacid dehydrogenase
VTDPAIKTIGFIGLGSMGAHMARRLIEAGHDVCVLDLKPEAVEAAVALGASSASTPREVGDRADVVFLSLPRPGDVRAVVLGPDGLVEGSRFRAYVDLSTTGPEVAGEIAAAVAERGRIGLDAPVSGGPNGAAHGTLCIMVGGDPATYAQVAPFLDVLGKTVVFLGDEPGQGQAMKVINNTISASCFAASSEGLVLGAKAGLDPDAMIAVLNASSARNTHTEDKIPRCILPGTFDFGFQVGLMLKDVRLCLGLAQELDVPMWVSGSVQQLFAQASGRTGPTGDITTLTQLVEEWGGAEVRSRDADTSAPIRDDAALTT